MLQAQDKQEEERAGGAEGAEGVNVTQHLTQWRERPVSRQEPVRHTDLRTACINPA